MFCADMNNLASLKVKLFADGADKAGMRTLMPG